MTQAWRLHLPALTAVCCGAIGVALSASSLVTPSLLGNISFLLLLLVVGAAAYIVVWNQVHRDGEVTRAEPQAFAASGHTRSRPPHDLGVISYNIGYATGQIQAGFTNGTPASDFRNNLDEIVRLAQQTEADLLLLQEVDICSKRSQRMNQFAYLQKQLQWPYAAHAATWKGYIPFYNIGRVHECAVILSRYPIIHHTYKTFTCKPTTQNKWLNFACFPFVWKSVIQHATIAYGDHPLQVFNLHLDVFSRRRRQEQFSDLLQWIHDDNLAQPILIGGDLNYHAQFGKGQVDLLDVDGPSPETLPPFFENIWHALPGMQEAFIDADTTPSSIHHHVTFPELQKRHDFLFFSKDFKASERQLIQSITASDHLPIYLRLRLLQETEC